MAEKGGQQVSFSFQVGLVKDKITVDITDLTLKYLKTLATSFVNEKFPEHEVTRLAERLLVFRHDYQSENVLQTVNSVTEVREGTVIEIVLNTQPLGDEDVEIRPHSLVIHSYKTPTFCDFCREMLFGMFKQGLKCELCGLNFHKRCVFKVPNDCSYKKKRRNSLVGSTNSNSSLGYQSSVSSSVDGASSLSTTSNYLVPPPATREGSVSPGSRNRSPSNIHGRPAWVEVKMANRPKIPHTWVIHTYTKPTKCHFCNKLLVGVIKQGVQCKDCRYNAHKKCAERVPNDCSGELPTESLDGSVNESSAEYDERNGEDEDEEEMRRSPAEDADTEIVTPSNLGEHLEHAAAQPTHSNIPVQRLVQSVKQTKRVGAKTIKEGWMVHFTDKDNMRKRHYWRLDSKSITMFKSETGPNYYKEVPLSEILSVEKSKKATDGDDLSYCFEMKTATVVFYVGEDSASAETEGDTAANKEAVAEFESAIRSAVTPVVKTSSQQPGATSAAAASKETEAAPPPPAARDTASKTVTVKEAEKEKEKEGRETEISKAYQIFPDEVLGSGQFGIVYGGVHRISGRAVAIKVIDKMRFPTKQEAALKNEVSILQNLHHPGVVNLERMFETPERIFVVMEKLRGDMLEMILSSEMGRLSERITKFLVTQILVALKHLHSKNIVHCDLKPENVLLSSDSDFPQVKLCDFGFSRIIGEKGFRKSIVGTPAYLAPEVLRNKGYNRSLDMWSTGVIIYVSLSGTFPFNEDEDIHEQIQNASFMYPPHPWKEISKDAIELITNLLQVKLRKRYSVDKSLLHPWLQDYQCWSDMRQLEARLKERWLTHESDDHRWETFGRQRHLSDVAEKVAGIAM